MEGEVAKQREEIGGSVAKTSVIPTMLCYKIICIYIYIYIYIYISEFFNISINLLFIKGYSKKGRAKDAWGT